MAKQKFEETYNCVIADKAFLLLILFLVPTTKDTYPDLYLDNEEGLRKLIEQIVSMKIIKTKSRNIGG